MITDLTFATDEARHSRTPTPQADVDLRVFAALTAAGLGDEDIVVVQAFLESHPRKENK